MSFLLNWFLNIMRWLYFVAFFVILMAPVVLIHSLMTLIPKSVIDQYWPLRVLWVSTMFAELFWILIALYYAVYGALKTGIDEPFLAVLSSIIQDIRLRLGFLPVIGRLFYRKHSQED